MAFCPWNTVLHIKKRNSSVFLCVGDSCVLSFETFFFETWFLYVVLVVAGLELGAPPAFASQGFKKKKKVKKSQRA